MKRLLFVMLVLLINSPILYAQERQLTQCWQWHCFNAWIEKITI